MGAFSGIFLNFIPLFILLVWKQFEALRKTLSPEEMQKTSDKIRTSGEKNFQKQKAIEERLEKKTNELLTAAQREHYAALKKELSETLERVRKEQFAKQEEKKLEDYEIMSG